MASKRLLHITVQPARRSANMSIHHSTHLSLILLNISLIICHHGAIHARLESGRLLRRRQDASGLP